MNNRAIGTFGVNISKVGKEFNFQPECSLEEGLKEMSEWFREI